MAWQEITVVYIRVIEGEQREENRLGYITYLKATRFAGGLIRRAMGTDKETDALV